MVWHTYKNVGATPGRFIAVLSPAGMERFFREIGRPLDDPRNPPVPAGPPSDEQRQQMMAIIARHMEILPPEAIVGQELSQPDRQPIRAFLGKLDATARRRRASRPAGGLSLPVTLKNPWSQP
ncbi:MAG: hypothetical protein ACPL8I_14780 [Chloroflexaceae bacterium]